MSSRDEILKAVVANLPVATALPDLKFFGYSAPAVAQFSEVLSGIGGQAIIVQSVDEIKNYIISRYDSKACIVSVAGTFSDLANLSLDIIKSGHGLSDVDLAIMEAHFAVCENGAVWVTEEQMGNRALPFICEHLCVIVKLTDLVPTMHEAYDRLSGNEFGFGTFIAGPSKTADIEQSLVLGAHGPVSMTVFLLRD